MENNGEGNKAESQIVQKIYFIRGEKVMLDEDLAELYGVETKRLNEQIKRNPDRFPPDFMFQLTDSERLALRSQFATSNIGKGGRRYNPFVFTEQGIAMLSSVLNSPVAVQVNIQIIRIFIRMRKAIAGHRELFLKMEALEKEILNTGNRLDKHDEEIQLIFETIKTLLSPEKQEFRKIGYRRKEEEE